MMRSPSCYRNRMGNRAIRTRERLHRRNVRVIGTYRSVATSRDPSDNRAPERSGLRSGSGALCDLWA